MVVAINSGGGEKGKGEGNLQTSSVAITKYSLGYVFQIPFHSVTSTAKGCTRLIGWAMNKMCCKADGGSRGTTQKRFHPMEQWFSSPMVIREDLIWMKCSVIMWASCEICCDIIVLWRQADKTQGWGVFAEGQRRAVERSAKEQVTLLASLLLLLRVCRLLAGCMAEEE